MTNGTLHASADGSTGQWRFEVFEAGSIAGESGRFVVAASSHVAAASPSLCSASACHEAARGSPRTQNSFHREASRRSGRSAPAVCSRGRGIVECFGDARLGSLPAARRAWLRGVAIDTWNRNTGLIDWGRPSWRKCIGLWFLKDGNNKTSSVY